MKNLFEDGGVEDRNLIVESSDKPLVRKRPVTKEYIVECFFCGRKTKGYSTKTPPPKEEDVFGHRSCVCYSCNKKKKHDMSLKGWRTLRVKIKLFFNKILRKDKKIIPDFVIKDNLTIEQSKRKKTTPTTIKSRRKPNVWTRLTKFFRGTGRKVIK